MCTVLLPPGGYPIAVKDIISYHIINRKKANWTGHILCRNCLVTHVNGGRSNGKTKKKTEAATE
jgi:hypothetical protein